MGRGGRWLVVVVVVVVVVAVVVVVVEVVGRGVALPVLAVIMAAVIV